MKRTRIILFILTTLLLSDVFAQDTDPFKQKNERIKQNRINQKVKAVRMYVHAVDDKGKTSRKGVLRSEQLYNEKGLQLKSSTWFPNLTLINETEYNEKDLPIKMVSKNGEQVRQTLVYEYDSEFKPLSVKYYKPDGTLSSVKDLKTQADKGTTSFNQKGEVTAKTASQYDSATRTYTSVLLSSEGALRYQNKYIFDEQGLVIEWSVIDNVQNKRFITRYVYDDKGNELEQHKYAIDGQPTEKFIAIYNEKNLEVENTWYQPYDKKKEVFRYEYEFY